MSCPRYSHGSVTLSVVRSTKSNGSSRLRPDDYRCSVLDGIVNFFDFVVRDGDAACGPVFPPVPIFEKKCRNIVWIAVNHDVAAGLVVAFFRGLDLLRVRVRNSER